MSRWKGEKEKVNTEEVLSKSTQSDVTGIG